MGLRPDRPTIVYANRAREAFGSGTAIIIGGLEASLRRFAHYDYWDDKLRRSILIDSRADIISYGAPVLPGAMFLVSYLDGVPVCGLPGCVMYAKRTIFDLLLPRLLADAPITAEDIARLGEGGLCLNCEVCHWPNCGFGHC